MQIFPSTTSDSSQEVSSSWYSWEYAYDAAQSSFDQLLDQELNAAAQEYEQAGSQYSETWSQAADSLGQSAAGSVQRDQEERSMLLLKVTEEDFSALEQKLLESGLSQDDIDELHDEVASENGVNWKQLLDRIDEKLRAASGGQTSTELSTDERRELMSLFSQLGFTPQQSEQLLTDMNGGRQDAAWVKISNAIARLSPDKVLNVGKAQLAALGKAMGLPDSFQAKLSTLFNGRQSLDLMPEELRAVVNLMRKEGLLARHEILRENSDLREALLETMEQAKGRSEIQALADNRDSRDARASRVLIKDAAEERFGIERARANNQDVIGDKRTRADADESGWDRRARAEANQSRSRVQEDPEGALRDRLAKEADRTASGKEAANRDAASALTDRTAKYRVGHEHESGLDQEAEGENRESPWEELAKRITLRMENVSSAAMARSQAAEAVETAAEVQADTKPLSQRVLDTIQDGMLRNLGQGRNQITLHLEPASLGKVSVILQVHNKEVTALIKTENQDVANMVSDQLDHIRQHLEAQGLKVQRLDVQTQLNQDQASNWLGMEQHNLGRDQETQQSLMSAWKRLLTDNSEQAAPEGAAETVARPLQGDGLHIIA